MSKKYKRNNNNGNGNNNGKPHTRKEFQPLTEGQNEYVRAMVESDIVFCTGPAGSGKTACAVGLACDHFISQKINSIIITRPIVETGQNRLGALPGDLYCKIHPYLRPVLEELYIYLGKHNTENYLHTEAIQIIPLEVMRGYSMHRSFIILDEGQNATLDQLKMLLTRIGRHSTIVITGDLEQSDLLERDIGLSVCIKKLSDIKGISNIRLTDQDIVRHGLIAKILEKLR